MLGRVEPHLIDVAVAPRVRPEVDARTLAIAGSLTLFVFVVLRTAWVCDDAYITLRTVDNFINGYGLRWNVAERVQAFTHPLWLLVLSAPYSITHEAFFTTLIVSIVLAVGAVYLFASRIASSFETMAIGLATFIFSKAFVEFSTSGLENPLSNLLLAAFVLLFLDDRLERRRWLTALWTLGALLYLTRPDDVLFVAPALAFAS